MEDDDRNVSRDDRAIKSGVRLIGGAATRNGCAQFALVSTRCGVNSIFDTMEMRLKWIVKSRGYNLWGKKGNSIRPFRDLSLLLIQLDYAAPPTDRPCPPQDSRVEGYRTPFRFDLVSPQRETCARLKILQRRVEGIGGGSENFIRCSALPPSVRKRPQQWKNENGPSVPFLFWRNRKNPTSEN